jgi:hypothetical protein
LNQYIKYSVNIVSTKECLVEIIYLFYGESDNAIFVFLPGYFCSNCDTASSNLVATSLCIAGRLHSTWGPAHRRWLSEVVCPTPAQQIVFQADVRAVNEHTERLQRLAQTL